MLDYLAPDACTLPSLLDLCRPTWHRWAACRDRPLHLFYEQDTAEAALAVCAGCPVRATCLAAAIEEEGTAFHIAGVRGGTTAAQRRRLRRARRVGQLS